MYLHDGTIYMNATCYIDTRCQSNELEHLYNTCQYNTDVEHHLFIATIIPSLYLFAYTLTRNSKTQITVFKRNHTNYTAAVNHQREHHCLWKTTKPEGPCGLDVVEGTDDFAIVQRQCRSKVIDDVTLVSVVLIHRLSFLVRA